MSGDIILKVILFGIALSMDAFAISVTDSLVYKDINKKKIFFIAGVFGLMQAIMPLIGYWLVEGVTNIVGAASGAKAGEIMSRTVSWIAFALLILVGGKMLIEGIKETRHPNEAKANKSFTVKEVLLYGVLTSIDALAVGVSFHAKISTNTTIWLHVSIILGCTFIISLIGLLLGKGINKLLKGKYSVSCILGGLILIALAISVLVSIFK